MQKIQYTIMAELEDEHWWFLAKRKFIRSLLPPAKGELSILDIGCGTGGTSKFLTQWGDVTGIEQSVFAFPYLKKLRFPFIAVSIEDYSPAKGSFDLICILDVLYHKNIRNDQKVLNKVFMLLRPGGFLCITDCALPSFFSHHDTVMEARTRYSLPELITKVETAGFRVTRASYIYFFVFPLFLVQRLLNKFLRFSTVNRVSSGMNDLLLLLCTLEAWLLQYVNFPIGSSVIILAKKM